MNVHPQPTEDGASADLASPLGPPPAPLLRLPESRRSVNYPERNHRAKLRAWFIDTRQAILSILKP